MIIVPSTARACVRGVLCSCLHIAALTGSSPSELLGNSFPRSVSRGRWSPGACSPCRFSHLAATGQGSRSYLHVELFRGLRWIWKHNMLHMKFSFCSFSSQSWPFQEASFNLVTHMRSGHASIGPLKVARSIKPTPTA